MKISELKDMHKEQKQLRFSGLCHDCGRDVEIVSTKTDDGEISIKGGAVYGTPEEMLFKCDDCFNKEKTLKNHQQCEVYSRIVGYLRPISQWNKGKLSEFDNRKTLKV
jgi:anaerobic ribonucleoside-triphosphate reductase